MTAPLRSGSVGFGDPQGDGEMVGEAVTTYAAMGRFGKVMLVNGETELSFTARNGEVVRLHLTNTANTRVFNIGLPGAQLKLVGGDSGRYEHEQFVEGVLLAPSERAVIDVLFEASGQVTLEHRTPHRSYRLGTIAVSDERAEPSLVGPFRALRTNVEMVAERERIASYLDAEPDKTVALVAEMDLGEPELPTGAPVAYVCPMHTEVVSDEQGRCPKCGMKLVATDISTIEASGEQEHEHHHEEAAAHGDGDDAGGMEREDDMLEVNRATTPATMRWKLIDRSTGAEGSAIDWRFRVGDQVKIRLVNEIDSDHPMHHPFHIHGGGRFLVLAREEVVESNLVWKDTVLVPTGQTVDLLVDVTNPGRWMAHCHIAEHHDSGMMFSFTVES
jgi:FtsP/CotA-like multicopper oxidase with cupredoxin domain